MKKELHYLSFDEWERLQSSVSDTRDQIILRLIYETGCTVNELVNVKINDIDFSKCIVKIHAENSRNHEYREAVLSSRLCNLIKAFAQENTKSEYVLYTRQSGYITTKRIRQIVQGHCSNIGIRDANPQILRYTHIAHAYLKNIPVDAIQKQVGMK
jgi:integrase